MQVQHGAFGIHEMAPIPAQADTQVSRFKERQELTLEIFHQTAEQPLRFRLHTP
jgi:hypothetical protein